MSISEKGMENSIESLSVETLLDTFKRLKKDKKRFKTLIVREPLDYLDFEVELESNLKSIEYKINSQKYRPDKPYYHYSAKSKGINRPTVIFSIEDALIYRFCLEQIGGELKKKTYQKNIKGGIKITANKDPNSGEEFYEKWFGDWKDHLDNIRESLKDKNYLVMTDIASYFENINILILKDMVRSDVEGKWNLLNLLFYFLENCILRNNYQVNSFNGLPQDGIGCSGILAYYFLRSVDQNMENFCNTNSAEFYRINDDMNVTVEEEVIGRKALKNVTDSLRKLNLVASIEKTSILDKNRAKSELFFEENDHLTSIEENIIEKRKRNKVLEQESEELEKYFQILVERSSSKYKNWYKILKRFITLCIYTKSDFLLPQISELLIEYPILFSDDKIGKYLIRSMNSSFFEATILNLIKYLYSKENLYPNIETNLIESFLLLPRNRLNKNIKDNMKKLSEDIFFKKNSYNSNSDYTRALSCLLIYAFNKQKTNKIAEHYINYNEEYPLLRKYLIFTSLTNKNQNIRNNVLNKARKEQNNSINRLISFIDNIDKYKEKQIIKNFILKDEIYMI